MNKTNKPAKPFLVGQGEMPGPLKGAVAAIGNFDGVHRGHRAVIAAARNRAATLGRPAVALTFSPPPRQFFRPDLPLFRLSDDASRLRLLAATGLDGAVVLTFNAAMASMSADDFVAKILLGKLGISGATVGFDFHFGKNRAGSPDFLREQGAKHGFAVDIVPKLEDEGRRLSSGAVRGALAEGKVVEAAELLGGPWFVSGEVIHGEKRGRELGFPTANIQLDPDCGLKHGIYAVRAKVGGELIGGVASFGRRPTFDNGAPLLEVFLFDFAGELYGETIDVAFIGWIRGEEKFGSIDDLKRHMAADSTQAREVLARAPEAFPALGKPD